MNVVSFILIGSACFTVACRSILEKSTSTTSDNFSNNNREIRHLLSDSTLFPAMVLLPSGSFRMGNETMVHPSESPVRTVSISSFYLAETEVTQLLYKKITGQNPSAFLGDSLPVTSVSWYDAIKFCNLLSQHHGFEPVYRISGDSVFWDTVANGFRLPSEAEWEYAARSGSDKIPIRNIDSVAWTVTTSGDCVHVVGQKQKNKFGIYDMIGNVWEWCWDAFSYDSYKILPTVNPRGVDENGRNCQRILRGGAYSSSTFSAAYSHRFFEKPARAFTSYGFRLARNK